MTLYCPVVVYCKPAGVLEAHDATFDQVSEHVDGLVHPGLLFVALRHGNDQRDLSVAQAIGWCRYRKLCQRSIHEVLSL